MKAPFRWGRVGRAGLAAALGATAIGFQLALSGPPPTIEGRAEAISGDGLSIEGRYIRLEGADAPEFSQTCTDTAGVQHAAGRLARERLAELIQAAAVSCRLARGHVGEGVLVAACSANGVDLVGALVDEGLAVATSSLSDYAERAAQARHAGLGVWGMNCRTPEAWRSTPGGYFGWRDTTDRAVGEEAHY